MTQILLLMLISTVRTSYVRQSIIIYNCCFFKLLLYAFSLQTINYFRDACDGQTSRLDGFPYILCLRCWFSHRCGINSPSRIIKFFARYIHISFSYDYGAYQLMNSTKNSKTPGLHKHSVQREKQEVVRFDHQGHVRGLYNLFRRRQDGNFSCDSFPSSSEECCG